MIFYLGTHMTQWATTVQVPWFLSANRLRVRPVRARVASRWALDSGGFTELGRHGKWTVEPKQYADEVYRWAELMGAPDWVAPQDWMCEPAIRAATSKSVDTHQHLTCVSVLALRDLVGSNVIPVLQGWGLSDYFAHVRMYESYGINLTAEPLVGVGTVCRRQATGEGISIVGQLAGSGLRLHGFGLKSTALRALAPVLASADSMAWSFAGRKQPNRNGCHKRTCANCLHWALEWREQLLAESSGSRPQRSAQCDLFMAVAQEEAA